MSEGRPKPTLMDYMAIAISPSMIILLVGSLAFFLLMVFYAGDFVARLYWTTGCFVFAAVLISRVSIEEGAERASLFGIALGVVAALAMSSFTNHPWWAWLVLGVIWWCASHLVWNCTVVDDDDDASGAGLLEAAGFDAALSTTAVEPKEAPPLTAAARRKRRKVSAAKATETAPRKQDSPEQPWIKRAFAWWQRSRSQKAPPGLTVVYFSLAALPIFGLGQRFIASAERLYAFQCLFVYVASALGLLVTTSFLGLRRYLRQRRLEMPIEMAGAWLAVGAAMVGIVLILAVLIPRPQPEYAISSVTGMLSSPEREASPYSPMHDSPAQGESSSGAPDEKQMPEGSEQQAEGSQKDGSGQSAAGSDAEKSGQSGDSSQSQQSGSASSSGQQQSGNSNPSQSQQSQGQQTQQAQQNQSAQSSGEQKQQQQSNNSAQQPAGQQQSNTVADSKSDQQRGGKQQAQSQQPQQAQQSQQQQSANSEMSGNEGSQQQQQQQLEQQQQAAKQDGSAESGEQKQSDQQASPETNKGSQDSMSSKMARDLGQRWQQRPRLRPPPLASAGGMLWLLKMLVYAVVVIAVIYVLIRYGAQVRAFLHAMWRELVALWQSIFGGQSAAADETSDEIAAPVRRTRPFASYADPFASGAAANARPHTIVQYSFEALEAWAADHDGPRLAEETPLEFSARLADEHPQLAEGVQELTSLYARVAYARDPLQGENLAGVRQLWPLLKRTAATVPSR